MSYEEKKYAIVVVIPSGAKLLFGRVRRSPEGDVYAVWAEDESPENLARGSNAHSSYHASGEMHSKSYGSSAFTRSLQVPQRAFRGNQPIAATNVARVLSPTFPATTEQFDDVFEIPVGLISGNPNQFIAVDLVEPGVPPAQVTTRDRVLAQKVFRDDVPWIVATLAEAEEST